MWSNIFGHLRKTSLIIASDLDLHLVTDLIKAWTAAEVTEGEAAITTNG